MSLKSNVKSYKSILNNSNKTIEEMENESFTTTYEDKRIISECLKIVDYLESNDINNKTKLWVQKMLVELNKDVDHILSEKNDKDYNHTLAVKKIITYISVLLGISPSFYSVFDKMVKNNEFNLDYSKLGGNNNYMTLFNRFYRSEVLEETGKKELSWDEYYSLACNYYLINNNLDLENNYKTFDGKSYNENGYNLSKWISKQRSKYFNNKLDEDKKNKLLSIGMIFEYNKGLKLK